MRRAGSRAIHTDHNHRPHRERILFETCRRVDVLLAARSARRARLIGFWGKSRYFTITVTVTVARRFDRRRRRIGVSLDNCTFCYFTAATRSQLFTVRNGRRHGALLFRLLYLRRGRVEAFAILKIELDFFFKTTLQCFMYTV